MDPEGFSETEVREYLERINYTGSRDPSYKTLSELQQCHLTTVPFENLSVYGKEEIVLSKDWLFNKIERRRRGGFCFELNTLFCFLLDYFGFKYQRHAARVFSKTGALGLDRDHLTLLVDIDGIEWLTDIAFGDSFYTSLRFSGFLGEEQEQLSGIYRIRQESDLFYYEEKVKAGAINRDDREEKAQNNWIKRYRFDLVPRTTDDFHEMCVHHQTHPSSPFTHARTIAKPWGRVTLSGDKLVTSTFLGNNKVMRETKQLLGGEEEVVSELEQKFGIRKESCFYPRESIYFSE